MYSQDAHYPASSALAQGLAVCSVPGRTQEEYLGICLLLS